MNNLTVTGNIATDIELRTLPTEAATSVLEGRLAVRKRTRKEGTPDAIFVDFKLYGKTAELVEKHCSKGSRIGIIGRLDVDQWTDNDTGKGRSRTYIVGDQVEFLDTRKNDTSAEPAQAEAAAA